VRAQRREGQAEEDDSRGIGGSQSPRASVYSRRSSRTKEEEKRSVGKQQVACWARKKKKPPTGSKVTFRKCQEGLGEKTLFLNIHILIHKDGNLYPTWRDIQHPAIPLRTIPPQVISSVQKAFKK
jgi:hypothetical protein